MNIKIYRTIPPDLLYECDAPNQAAALALAIRANVDLTGADLEGFIIGGPERVNLSRAHLIETVMAYSDLSNVDFTYANLHWGNLRECNLRGSVLMSANLRGADLSNSDCSMINAQYASFFDSEMGECDFTDANLRYANLANTKVAGSTFDRADLRGAHVAGSNLYATTTSLASFLKYLSVSSLLQLDWRYLPDALALELMRHDAESCGEEAMNKWAAGGSRPFFCPHRDYLFVQRRELWEPGPPKLRGMKLLQTLWEAKGGKM